MEGKKLIESQVWSSQSNVLPVSSPQITAMFSWFFSLKASSFGERKIYFFCAKNTVASKVANLGGQDLAAHSAQLSRSQMERFSSAVQLVTGS